MKKKGDLSIGIIIAAAIGVLVLVIVGAVFINQMRSTKNDINGCASVSAVEVTNTENTCEDNQQFVKRLNTTTICCLNLDLIS